MKHIYDNDTSEIW